MKMAGYLRHQTQSVGIDDGRFPYEGGREAASSRSVETTCRKSEF